MSVAALIRRMMAQGVPDEDVIREAIRVAEEMEAPPPAYEPRFSTKARKMAFNALCDRDGPECVKCGVRHRLIWRRAGTWSNDDWGADEDGRPIGKLSKVICSSNLEVDHRLALHVGGTNDLDNLWLLCRDCHKQKTAREQSERLRRLFADGRS